MHGNIKIFESSQNVKLVKNFDFFNKIMTMQSWMCSYHAFTMILFGILTPMIASAMALERYFGIRHGYFYMLHFNPYRARYFNFTLYLSKRIP